MQLLEAFTNIEVLCMNDCMGLTPGMFEPPVTLTVLRSLEISRNWQLKGSFRAIARSLPNLVYFQASCLNINHPKKKDFAHNLFVSLFVQLFCFVFFACLCCLPQQSDWVRSMWHHKTSSSTCSRMSRPFGGATLATSPARRWTTCSGRGISRGTATTKAITHKLKATTHPTN